MEQVTYAAMRDTSGPRYACGASWLYVFVDDKLSVFVLWGRMRAEDIAVFTQHVPLPVALGLQGHRMVFDGRRVETVEPGALTMATTVLAAHWSALARTLDRLAVVEAASMAAAVIAHGFFEVAKPPFAWKAFTTTDDANAWVGAPPELGRQLDELWADVAGAPEVVRSLRGALALDLSATLEIAARSLGVSPRTLQRRLHDSGTSFQRELDVERLRAAKQRMLDGDDKLEAIARDVGCASGSHLAALFRRFESCSPSEWRKRGRASS